jgi:hypothetical protein
MTEYPTALDIEARAIGATYRGTIRLDGAFPVATDERIPMSVGLSPNPKEYDRWFSAVSPGLPAHVGAFSPPGSGLPNLNGTINWIPEGSLPWFRVKDRVPIEQLLSFFDALREKYNPPTGRLIRYTPQHEWAPANDRAEYLAYLTDVVTVARTCPWMDIVQVQSLYAMRWRADTTWLDWFLPGVSVGFDIYPPEFGVGGGYEPAESILGLPIAAARILGAPRWYIPELGAEIRKVGPAGRARWLGEVISYADENDCSAVQLWCGRPEERGGRTYDYRPIDDETLQLYRDALTPQPIP